MPHLTDGTSLASDLNALTAGAEERLLRVHKNKAAIEAIVNARLRNVTACLNESIPDVQILVINTLVMGLVRSIPGRTVI